ncbi:MAG TPA: hypothetical protein VFC56_07545 [Stellaceae bacterium]|nr:hypothetical protein [Stellaceae bacterium]
MKSVPADLVPAEIGARDRDCGLGRAPLPRELVGEAVERYLSERRYFPKDEVHGKIARGLESLRQGRGLDGEAVMAELLTELDPPGP